jgi:hypothetical protein
MSKDIKMNWLFVHLAVLEKARIYHGSMLKVGLPVLYYIRVLHHF